ncbi:SSD domain-containing protein [Candidatus Hydrogenisulfobacillus filiaventi]|uniref:SSD domain-containing protein n=1 Tax=Candidatus Hydrogenisulfobacillus filiaventi TaxID=2707344 RepID=A0A6F8ZDF9_9FIRM|nr:SSD domain-containing protein [Candidatus Hydrogenisulfobacillus filiaventi]
MAALARRPGVRVEAVTPTAVSNAVLREAKRTLHVSGLIALPLLLVLLFLVYDSLVAALLPLLVAGVGATGALAVIDVLEAHLRLSVYLTDIVSFFALGVGIDYSLFLSTRFRTALRRGSPVEAAVDEAMATAGRSVFFSGLAVGLSLLSLLIPRTPYWNGLAIGGAVAVFAVLAVTLTFLPALLAILGHATERGRLPRPAALTRFWAGLARRLLARPLPVLLAGLVLLAVPAWWARQFVMSTPANLGALLAPDTRLHLAVVRQQQDFGAGSIAPLPVVLESPRPLTRAAVWATAERVARRLGRLGDVARVAAPAGPPSTLARLAAGPLPAVLRPFAAPPGWIQLTVVARSGPDSTATARLLSRMQGVLAATLPRGWRWGIGGVLGLVHSFNRLVARSLPWVLAATAAVALGVLFAATGSLAAAGLGLVFDGLVALATAGVLVLVVQDGRWGFAPQHLDSSITPIIFVMLFGLSMDYEVILVHRIREYARRGLEARAAAEAGLADTGGMITGAGLTMVTVFLAELVSRLPVIRTLAVGMSVALLLDILVARMLLVPGSLALLGRWAWWPGYRWPLPDPPAADGA